MFVVADEGLAIKLRVRDQNKDALDLSSGVSSMEFILESPQRVQTTVDPITFVTDGSDGRIQYVLESGDLSEPGRWKVFAHIVQGSKDFRTTKAEFVVEPN